MNDTNTFLNFLLLSINVTAAIRDCFGMPISVGCVKSRSNSNPTVIVVYKGSTDDEANPNLFLSVFSRFWRRGTHCRNSSRQRPSCMLRLRR